MTIKGLYRLPPNDNPPDDDDKRFFRRMLVLSLDHDAPLPIEWNLWSRYIHVADWSLIPRCTFFTHPHSFSFMTAELNSPIVHELALYRDLTGQVTQTEDRRFAYGDTHTTWVTCSDMVYLPLNIRSSRVNGRILWRVMYDKLKLVRGIFTNERILVTVTRPLNYEMRIWHRLSHANILPFLGVCSDLGPYTATVSPLCDNGSVLQYRLTIKADANRLKIVSTISLSKNYFL